MDDNPQKMYIVESGVLLDSPNHDIVRVKCLLL